MSGPLIFNSRSRVKPGMVERYRAHIMAATELVESEEPQLIAFNNYLSDDGTDVCTVQIHPDADSLDTHIKFYQERLMGWPSRRWTPTNSTSMARRARPPGSSWSSTPRKLPDCSCGSCPYTKPVSYARSRCDRPLQDQEVVGVQPTGDQAGGLLRGVQRVQERYSKALFACSVDLQSGDGA